MDESGPRLVYGGVERFTRFGCHSSLELELRVLMFGGFKARALVICLGISLAIAGLVTSALKSSIASPVPDLQSVRMVQLQKARPKFLTLFKKPVIRFSDSSDHTRSGTIVSVWTRSRKQLDFAATYFRFVGKRVVGCAGLSLWRAISRIYLGAHWPPQRRGGDTLSRNR